MTLLNNSIQSIRPEIHLILCCVRLYIEPEAKRKIESLLQEDLDWPYLIKTADEHRVLPLIYKNLSENFYKFVPPPTLDHLRNWYHINTIHNKLLTRALIELLETFTALKIPCIVFKGPVSAAMIYNDVTLRQFSDLDVLVHEKDYDRTQENLVRIGYNKTCDWGFESGFQHESSRINIDIHRKFDGHGLSSELNFIQLLNRLEPIDIQNRKLLTLSAEDTLLNLCINFAKDLFINKTKLAQISDIANLIDLHPNLDWDVVIKRAGSCGTKRILFLCLSLSNQLLGTNLPMEVIQKIDSHTKLKSLVPEVYDRLMNLLGGRCQFLERRRGYLADRILFLKLKERWRDKLPTCYLIPKNYLRLYLKNILINFPRIMKLALFGT